MKIKLIFPDLGPFPLVYRRTIPVLAPAVLAALTPPDFEIDFTDERLNLVEPEEECDLVAISVMTPQAQRAYELARHYRKRGIPVVLGGVHVSLLPEEAQARPRPSSSGRPRRSGPPCWRIFGRADCKKSTAASLRRRTFPFPGGTSSTGVSISRFTRSWRPEAVR